MQGGGPAAPAATTGRGLAPAAWTHFFPPSEFQPLDRRAKLISELLPLLRSDAGLAFLSRAQLLLDGSTVAPLDVAALREATGIDYLADALTEQPEDALACISITFHEALITVHKDTAQVLAPDGLQALLPPRIRPFNVGAEMFIRQLQGSNIGRMVTIRGTIVRMGVTRPLAIRMDFVCGKCGAGIPARFPEGKFTPPTRCAERGCRSKTFTPNRSSAECVDWRTVRVQELIGADKQQAGQVPRTIQVELWRDLTSSCMVGDVVVVTGVVKVLASGDDLSTLGNGSSGAGAGKGSKGGQRQELFVMYLDAVTLQNCSGAAAGRQNKQQLQQPQQSGPGPQPGLPPSMAGFTQRDLQFIVKFTQEYDGDQLRQLAHSLCPSICGHELVKAGLILALMGGVRKGVDKADAVPTRGDIHCLLVGDPGLGKSQLLQAAAAVAPRGVYVCGKTASAAGLTVSVVRDAMTGDYVFEAGAVVLADRGACCIDEFDKMPHEHMALLEAMEQQEVSVAKAGLVASLPARTSVLAAANPVGGHYNRAKSVCENLKMSPAILSRFDLLFVLMDRPDEVLDQCVSEHVLALHSGLPGKAAAARQKLLEHRQAAPTLLLQGPSQGQGGPRLRLSQRLLLRPNDDFSPLPAQLLRKYIAYARQYVSPRLTDEALQVLQDFYLQLRQQVAPGSAMPVTARQLESLVRLSEARARLELREEVTRSDAEDVVDLLREALYDRFIDELTCIDFRADSSLTGFGAGSRAGSKAGEAKRFLTALRRSAERQGRDVFSTGELHSLANDIGLQVKDMSSFFDQLNEGGDILKAGSGQYRVRGVNPASASQGGGGAGGYGATQSQGSHGGGGGAYGWLGGHPAAGGHYGGGSQLGGSAGEDGFGGAVTSQRRRLGDAGRGRGHGGARGGRSNSQGPGWQGDGGYDGFEGVGGDDMVVDSQAGEGWR